jgi:peptidoglycan hydrolase-like protein with peptidoglycan-binding domain
MKKFSIISAACLALIIMVGSAGIADAAIVGGTMKLGSRGANVSALQQFLASNRDIYAEGMVSGFYGPLTREAVKQFQLHYNLTPDGVAGPATIGRLNSVMAAGRGLDIYAPIISNVHASTSGRTANLSFVTSEPARAYVFYDTNALVARDADMSFTAPTISGSTASTVNFSNSSALNLTSLNTNSTYNYMLMAIDQSGNVNVVLPAAVHIGS